MSIASKEARESNYWLRLLMDSGICDTNEVQELLAESNELVRILTSIVKTGSEERSATKNSKLRTQN